MAAEYLESLGYEILERNFRCRFGEVDIIAKDGKWVVVVEVKAKTGAKFGRPEEMVGFSKQKKLIKLGQYYLYEKDYKDMPWRIDVVAVDFAPDGETAELRHHKGAVENVLPKKYK